MAQQNIDFGTFPDDPSADAIRTAFQKTQNNFSQLFSTYNTGAVTSVNQTPGAGITVNFPTGNVVISANIACLQVSTTSLKVGRGSDNTQSTVTITSSAQVLNIDVDPAHVYSNYFANVGNTPGYFYGKFIAAANDQPNISNVGTLVNLASNGTVNFTNASNVSLGAVGNVKISGGSTGQYLFTDGAGNLSFGTVSTSGVSNGTSNVNIPAINGNVNISSAGNANIVVVTGTGANITGTLSASGNANISNIGTGIITATGNITGANLIGPLASGNSNISVTANANITMYVAGNTTPRWTATSTGIVANGTFSISGNANIGNIGTAQVLASANITTPQFISNIATGNAPFVVASTTQVANLSVATAGSATTAGTVTTNAQPNITSTGTLSSLSVSGNANIGNIGTTQVFANANITTPQFISNIATGNAPFVVSSTTQVANLSAATSGSATTAGTVTTNAQPNITSTGTLASLSVTANANIGNIGTTQVFANANITTPQFISNIATGNAPFVVTRTTQVATLRVATAGSATTAGTVTTNAQPNITSTGTLASLSVSGNANIGNIGTGNITANYFIGNGSQLTGITISAGSSIVNGNSNVTVAANSNINMYVNGNTNVRFVVTDTGANIAGTLSASGNANVGNIGTTQVFANANITTPQFISNIATGNAPLTVVSTTRVTNLNVAYANVSDYGVVTTQNTGIYYPVFVNASATANYAHASNTLFSANLANGALIATTFVGALSGAATSATTAGTVTTAAQPNITSVGTLSSLTVTGTTTSGNFATAGNITASFLVSNVATGTAPFTVLSTTQVANLSVATAGTASTVTTNAQPNITSVGTLVNTTMGSSNSLSGGNLVSASYLTGTLTTAAQPNITSTGTLASLSATGNINGANIIATSYHIRSVATAITAAGSTQGTATALTKEINVVSTVTAGANGVVLPTAVAGMALTITNTSANALSVYPATTGIINSLAANASFSQPAGATLQFIATTTTQWYSVGATYA
jgi:hypothetical protein